VLLLHQRDSEESTRDLRPALIERFGYRTQRLVAVPPTALRRSRLLDAGPRARGFNTTAVVRGRALLRSTITSGAAAASRFRSRTPHRSHVNETHPASYAENFYHNRAQKCKMYEPPERDLLNLLQQTT